MWRSRLLQSPDALKVLPPPAVIPPRRLGGEAELLDDSRRRARAALRVAKARTGSGVCATAHHPHGRERETLHGKKRETLTKKFRKTAKKIPT